MKNLNPIREKTIWQGIKQNHLLMMAICCLVPLVLFVGILSFFKAGNYYWIWLIILLCPLTHIFMMRGQKHTELFQCPECGLEYKEKEWAEKCETWCKKYKSCNLEITKHAVRKQ